MYKIKKEELYQYCGLPVYIFERNDSDNTEFNKWWDILDKIDDDGYIWTAYSEIIHISYYGGKYVMYTLNSVTDEKEYEFKKPIFEQE